MSTPSHDAQREMEQRALRNVRGLVDRMEDAEVLDGRRQRRLLLALVGGIALALVVVLAMFVLRKDSGATRTIELPAAGSPAAAK